MNKTNIEYDGFLFPAVEIEGKKIDPECKDDVVYVVADIALWEAIERDCMNGDPVANGIDEGIFYYCYPYLISDDPTEEDVIEYFKGVNL